MEEGASILQFASGRKISSLRLWIPYSKLIPFLFLTITMKQPLILFSRGMNIKGHWLPITYKKYSILSPFQLFNTFSGNVYTLTLLGFPSEHWNFIMFNLLFFKLDHPTIVNFKLEFCQTNIQSYQHLYDFAENYRTALNNVHEAHTAFQIKPKAFNNFSTSKNMQHMLHINRPRCKLYAMTTINI